MGLLTQQDPIGIAGGLNLYGYANGDPINFSDPFGLCREEGPDGRPPTEEDRSKGRVREDPDCRRVINILRRMQNKAESAFARDELQWAIDAFEDKGFTEDVSFVRILTGDTGGHGPHAIGGNTWMYIDLDQNPLDIALTAFHEMKHHLGGFAARDGGPNDPDIPTAALMCALPAQVQAHAFRHQTLLRSCR